MASLNTLISNWERSKAPFAPYAGIMLAFIYLTFVAAVMTELNLPERTLPNSTPITTPSVTIDSVLTPVRKRRKDKCFICLGRTISPVKLICGHRFCNNCIRLALTNRDTCPLDMTPLFQSQNTAPVDKPTIVSTIFGGSFASGAVVTLLCFGDCTHSLNSPEIALGLLIVEYIPHVCHTLWLVHYIKKVFRLTSIPMPNTGMLLTSAVMITVITLDTETLQSWLAGFFVLFCLPYNVAMVWKHGWNLPEILRALAENA